MCVRVYIYMRRSRRTREYRPTRVETSIASVMSSQCLLQASPPWFLPSYHAHWQYIFDGCETSELYPRIPSRNPNNRRTCAISCLVPSWSENRMAERRNITYFNCFYRFYHPCVEFNQEFHREIRIIIIERDSYISCVSESNGKWPRRNDTRIW